MALEWRKRPKSADHAANLGSQKGRPNLASASRGQEIKSKRRNAANGCTNQQKGKGLPRGPTWEGKKTSKMGEGSWSRRRHRASAKKDGQQLWCGPTCVTARGRASRARPLRGKKGPGQQALGQVRDGQLVGCAGLLGGCYWAWIGLEFQRKGLGGVKGEISSDFLQFYFEHSLMFWLSFLPRMSDRCKINFFRK